MSHLDQLEMCPPHAITTNQRALYYPRLPIAGCPIATMKWAAVLLVLSLTVHPSASDDNSDIPHFPYGYSKCKNPGVSGLHCGDFDLPVKEEDVRHNFCTCRCGAIVPVAVEDLFKSSANCVRIKAEGNTGGYLFSMDNFDNNRHDVFHDLWFKKNNKKHRALSGSFWRIYYPWVNASSTSDNVPYAVQNILTTQFLSVTGSIFQKNWKQVETSKTLTQSGMWMFTLKKTNGRTIWSLQNQRTNEFLLQHEKAIGNHWWQGKIVAYDKKKWDKFPDGDWFFIHPCF